MITSTTAKESLQEDNPLIEYIETSNVSSIEMIARALQMDEDDVRNQLEDLLTVGLLHGIISEDGSRFFKSDVRVSSAPSIRSNAEELVLESADTTTSKYLMVGGILSIVGGLITRALTPLSETLQSIGASFVLMGIAILAGGWLMLSRKTSSVKTV